MRVSRLPRAAKESAPGVPSFFFHLLDYHAGYGVRLGKALTALAAGNAQDADLLFTDFCDFIRRNETSMQPNLDVYRVIEVATKYTGFRMLDAPL